MTPSGLDRQRAERFARLLDDGDQSSRDHRSPCPDDEAGLAALGRRLATIEAPGHIDDGFRTRLRAMLVAEAERAAQERTVPLASPAPVGAGARLSAGLARVRTLLSSSPESRRARTRGAIIAGVAVGAIAVSGISTASEGSMPGDALYGMKRSTERAQLAFAGTDQSRGALLLEFARVRLAEAEAVRGDSAAFTRLLAETDKETSEGVALLARAAAESEQAAPLDTVAGFVARQRPALIRLLDGSTTDRERVISSLALLDLVSARIEALRPTLSCGTATAGPTDVLGPVPAGCTSGTGSTDAPSDRRRGDRVTASASRKPAPAVSAGASGWPVPTAMATDQPDASPSAQGTSKEPKPSKSRS